MLQYAQRQGPRHARGLGIAAGVLVSAAAVFVVRVERGVRLLDGRHGHVLEHGAHGGWSRGPGGSDPA